MHYIDLKRELASSGLLLSPDRNLRNLQRYALGRNPFSNNEVVEVTLTLNLDKRDASYRVLDTPNVPDHISLATWLRQIADTLEPDTPHRNNEKVHAEIAHYKDAEAWKIERIMGHYSVGRALLDGFSQIAEAKTISTGIGDPTLVVLDPDLPPRELGRIYDDIYVTAKVNAKNYRLWSDALQAARQEVEGLTTDDFMAYYWQRVPRLLERDHPPHEYSKEAMEEQLTKYLPELIEEFKRERLVLHHRV